LLESSWLLVITVILLTLNLTRMLPGEALAWYVIAYGFGRFFFEFLRADTIRLFFQGFSEAQWTALLLMSTVVYLEMATPLIFHWWHAAATLVLLAIVVFVMLMRRDKRLERYELLQPSHLKDFAETVSWLFDLVAGGIAVTSESLRPASPVEGLTSGHVRLAAVGIEDQNGRTFRYSISYQQGIMKAEIARLLAGLIRQLQHPADAYELVENEPGVFTLSIHHTPQQ
jgi:hypothetical protein